MKFALIFGCALASLGSPPPASEPVSPASEPVSPASGPVPPATGSSSVAVELSPPPPQIDVAAVDAVLARLPSSPTLRAVQDAALRLAVADARVGAKWLRRTRLAAALPTVSVQYDHRLDQGWTLDREVGEADALRNDAGAQAVVRAKATWELDRLIFSPDELRAARAALDLADFRERLIIEVTQLYYERLGLLVERELNPATDLDSALAAALRLRELEGLLTGLTGLDFSADARASARAQARVFGPPRSQ